MNYEQKHISWQKCGEKPSQRTKNHGGVPAFCQDNQHLIRESFQQELTSTGRQQLGEQVSQILISTLFRDPDGLSSHSFPSPVVGN